MQDAHEKGTPVIRPMFYDFPEDKNCWTLDGQYMFGGSLLVAPVMEAGQRTKTVYLPRARGTTRGPARRSRAAGRLRPTRR